MQITEVLKKPIITEKTYKMMEKNKFVFVIDNNATKIMVKKSFEIIFDKKVESINIIKKKSKKKRVGRFVGKTKRVKKAVITLKKGEIFTLFDEEQQEKISKITKEIKNNKKNIGSKTVINEKEKLSSNNIANKFKSYWKSFTTLDVKSKKEINKKDKEKTNKK